MTEIIERIVKSEGTPSKNDLWLKKDGEKLTLNANDNGEWKEIAGGGGGGAANAITYGEQELTEEQQMQARKNQGLYYKEGETVSSLIWDGVPSEDDIHIYEESIGLDYYLHKVSSVAIPPSQMLGATVSWEDATEERSATITQATVNTFEREAAQGYYNDPSVGFTVVLDDSIEDPSIGVTVPRGVWFASISAGGLSMFAKSIVLAEPYTEESINQIPSEYLEDAVLYTPQTLTESEQMQARKNQGLYYEEFVETTESKTANIDDIDYDSSTGEVYSWYSQTLVPNPPYEWYGGSGFHEIYVPFRSGVDFTVDAIKVNGRDGIVTRGEGWVMAVDPNNANAIVVIITSDNGATVETGLGTLHFSYKGVYASAQLTIYKAGEDYYIGSTTQIVTSAEVTYTFIDNPISKIPTKYIPTISSISASSTNNEVPGARAVYDTINSAVHPNIQTKTGSSVSITPNVLTSLGGNRTANFTVSFASGTSGIENEYKFYFNTGNSAPNVTWPAGITWVGNCVNNGSPVISASKHYEVSVVNLYGVIMEF